MIVSARCNLNSYRGRLMRIAVGVCLAWLGLTSGICQAADASPLQIGSSRQFFFDDRIVASSAGLQRVWRQPKKEQRPVLTKMHSWEGKGPYVYGTVLRDPTSDQFKIWYNCYVGGRPDYFVGY